MKKDSRRETKKGTKKVATKKKAPETGFTIGLDLGDRISQYCVLDRAGEVLSEGSVTTTETAMKQTWKSYSGSVVALEAGTHSSWVSRALRDAGLEGCLTVLGITSGDHAVRFRRAEAVAYRSLQCGEGGTSRCGEILSKAGTGLGKLLQSDERVTEHPAQVESPRGLVERPQSFDIIRVQFE